MVAREVALFLSNFFRTGDLYHHRPPSEAKMTSTLHHGPHSLDNQNITSRY